MLREKKDCQSCNWWSYVQSYRLYYDLCSKKYAENDTFPFFSPPPPSPLAALPFPSSLSFFLAPTVCIPSFYNFLFSLAARQIASRSMNFLERSCDCLSMFLLPPLFFSPSFFSLLTFTLFSLLFFLNPRNVGHSSWEAKSGENRVPPATRHLYINHVRFEHHEFAQNPFFFLYQVHIFDLSLRFIVFKIFWIVLYFFQIFYRQKLG